MSAKKKCEYCYDTGYYGDNGPGIRGNREYHPCDMCRADREAEANKGLVQRIDSLRELEDNWDTYGAPTPNEEAVAAAHNFLAELHAVPMTDIGGVIIEWEHRPLCFSVAFGNDGSIELSITRDGDSDRAFEGYDIVQKESK